MTEERSTYSIMDTAHTRAARDGLEQAEAEGLVAGYHVARIEASRNLLLASKTARQVRRAELEAALAELAAGDLSDEETFYRVTSHDRSALQEWLKNSPDWRGVRGKSRPFAGAKLGSKTERRAPTFTITDADMDSLFPECCHPAVDYDRSAARKLVAINPEEYLDEATGAVYPPGTLLFKDGAPLNIDVTPGHSEERYYAEMGGEKVWLDIYHEVGHEPEEEDGTDE